MRQQNLQPYVARVPGLAQINCGTNDIGSKSEPMNGIKLYYDQAYEAANLSDDKERFLKRGSADALLAHPFSTPCCVPAHIVPCCWTGIVQEGLPGPPMVGQKQYCLSIMAVLIIRQIECNT